MIATEPFHPRKPIHKWGVFFFFAHLCLFCHLSVQLDRTLCNIGATLAATCSLPQTQMVNGGACSCNMRYASCHYNCILISLLPAYIRTNPIRKNQPDQNIVARAHSPVNISWVFNSQFAHNTQISELNCKHKSCQFGIVQHCLVGPCVHACTVICIYWIRKDCKRMVFLLLFNKFIAHLILHLP